MTGIWGERVPPVFELMRADLSGVEEVVDRYPEPLPALRSRDARRAGSSPRQVHYRVLNTDLTDPPCQGEIDWCEECGGLDSLACFCDACGAEGVIVR